MSKEQIEERLELSSIIGCAVNDWSDFCEECHKDGYSPADTLEEYVAVSVLTKGYRKQSEGEWKKVYDKAPRYVCTTCNHLYNNKEYKYCPNCGAHMRGGKNE